MSVRRSKMDFNTQGEYDHFAGAAAKLAGTGTLLLYPYIEVQRHTTTFRQRTASILHQKTELQMFKI